MFSLRKQTVAEPAPPSEPDSTSGPSDARAQARALLSMLESGSAAPGHSIPPDRLRDLARDLVAKVESRDVPKPAPHPPAAAPEPPRPSLFSKAAPFAAATVAVPEPVAPPPASSRPGRPAQSDELPSAISAHDAPRANQSAPSLPTPRWVRDREAVATLLKTAFRPEDADAEHPAILALDLAGRPPREQAERLRTVPPGRIRATHRYLIELERAGA